MLWSQERDEKDQLISKYQLESRRRNVRAMRIAAALSAFWQQARASGRSVRNRLTLRLVRAPTLRKSHADSACDVLAFLLSSACNVASACANAIA
eukprot:6175418-Pleurochrysis_carterae.AAC.3